MTWGAVPLDLGRARRLGRFEIGLDAAVRCCGVGGCWVAVEFDLHGLGMSCVGCYCRVCGGRWRRARTRSETRACRALGPRGLGVGQTTAVQTRGEGHLEQQMTTVGIRPCPGRLLSDFQQRGQSYRNGYSA
jgi:hypothetical protein